MKIVDAVVLLAVHAVGGTLAVMNTLLRHCLLLAVPAIVAAQAPATAPRTITIGTIDSVWSPTLKEYRRYQIYTPPGYAQSIYQPRAYPVLYLLDGDAHFHSVTGLLQILSTGVNATYVLPEMIVVAIPNTDRTRDLTPTRPTLDPTGKPLPPSTAGGMGNFLQFMKTELIPHIDSTFRTEPYRVFVGHSLGGIATMKPLYTMPETFNAYVAIDPSLWWDGQLLLKKAADHFSRSSAPGGRCSSGRQTRRIRRTRHQTSTSTPSSSSTRSCRRRTGRVFATPISTTPRTITAQCP